MASIFEYSLFSEIVPAFLLIFVLVFAILQKSKLLGDGKSKNDALVSLAIALIFVIAEPARHFVVSIMPYLAVGLAVMLVFLVLYGFVGGELNVGPKWMKVTFGILAGLFVLVVILYVSGLWRDIDGFFNNVLGSGSWTSLLVLAIIAGAVAFVMKGKSGDGKSGKSSG